MKKFTEKLLGEIQDSFKDLSQEEKTYLEYHIERYEYLLGIIQNLGLVWFDVLDVGPSFQTKIIRDHTRLNVDTIGYSYRESTLTKRENHYECNLNSIGWKQILPAKKYYLVTMAEVLEHLLISPNAVFQNVYEWLQPEGFFIVQTPNACSYFKRKLMLLGYNPFEQIREGERLLKDPGHSREYTIAELIEFGAKNNFEIISYSIKNYFGIPWWAKAFNNCLPQNFSDGITIIYRKKG